MKWLYQVEIESFDDVAFSPDLIKEMIEESYDSFNDGTKITATVRDLNET